MSSDEKTKKYVQELVLGLVDLDQPILDQLEAISHLNPRQQMLEIASVLGSDWHYEAAERMLDLYRAYKNNGKLHPLFFLSIMNELRIYTPFYCEYVLEHAREYRIESERSEGSPFLGMEISRALGNSPVQAQECAKWVLKFLEDFHSAEPRLNGSNRLFPNVSRAENNISKFAFPDRRAFESYFEKRGPKFAYFFFGNFYNFSHLYDDKNQYLSALQRLMNTSAPWFWYGCPQWPDQ